MFNKKFYLLVWMLCFPVAYTFSATYQSYEALYETFPNRVFDEKKTTMQYSFTDVGIPINYGKWNNINLYLSGRTIEINHQQISPDNWYLFNNETITDTTLGTGAIVYFSARAGFESLICIEGHPVSSSGWESRNNTVYLINVSKGILIKPASLFASCLSIQSEENHKITFPAFVYYSSHTAPIKELVQGVILKEYSFSTEKHTFEDTHYRRFFKFNNQNTYDFNELQ